MRALHKNSQELTNSSGVPTTCVESSLPYQDVGTDKPIRKCADMMTLTGCGVSLNAQRNFSAGTRLIMDVSIGHVLDIHQNYKANTLLSLTNSRCFKYAAHYQLQSLAFAPIVELALAMWARHSSIPLESCRSSFTKYDWIHLDTQTNTTSSQTSLDFSPKYTTRK